MRVSRRLGVIVGLVWLSWVLAASYPLVRAAAGWRPEAIGPDVPYLLLPPGTLTDVVSSVSHFAWIIVIAIGCCVPVEAAKVMSRTLTRPVFAYVVLLIFQLALVGDFVRTYAYDWWCYLRVLAGFGRIDSLSWMRTSVTRTPWLAALVAVGATLLLLGVIGRARRDEGVVAANVRPPNAA